MYHASHTSFNVYLVYKQGHFFNLLFLLFLLVALSAAKGLELLARLGKIRRQLEGLLETLACLIKVLHYFILVGVQRGQQDVRVGKLSTTQVSSETAAEKKTYALESVHVALFLVYTGERALERACGLLGLGLCAKQAVSIW
mgnify:CR=1 FL=1